MKKIKWENIDKNGLKDIREDHDLKQEDIAKHLNISRQYYSRYELEQVEMPIRHYKKLAEYYNVSIDYLCGIVNTEKPLKITEKKELTAKQLAILDKYEKNKDLQKAVDKLLDIN